MLRRIDVAMLGLVVAWGLNFSIVKIAFNEMAPLVFNALRFGIATTLLLAVLPRFGGIGMVSRTEWPGIIAIGLIGHALYQICFIIGLAKTTAGNSSVILAMVPLFVALLSAALRIDRVAWRTWTGIGLAFAGLLLLVMGRSGLHVSTATLAGDALTLMCSVCWAMYTVFSRPFLQKMSALQLVALTMAAGLPVLILVSLPEMLRQPWAAVTWQVWASLAYSAILPVGIGYVVWYTSVQTMGGPRTAIYSNLIPIVSLASSWWLLGETLGPAQAVGAAVVLAGVSLART